MTKQDRIACLLAQGIAPSQVAAIVGVHQSYVSQLASDPDFKAHVEDLVVELAEKEGSANEMEERKHYRDKLAGAEHRVVDHILNSLVHSTAREAAAVLDIIGKRRDQMEGGGGKALLQAIHSQSSTDEKGITTTRVVQISIPDVCLPELKMAGNNEIVAIGDRSTAPMPVQALRKVLGADQETSEIGGYTYDHASA